MEYNLTNVAATLTNALDVKPPKMAASKIVDISKIILEKCKSQKCDRIFMYNPDAVALWVYQKYIDLFKNINNSVDLIFELNSVMPSVTPVCFGSMYTGVMPSVHGIQSYVKPVLKIETVFDCLISSGKKPAIVSTTDDSISMIFLEREMDYFIYDTVEECNQKALSLIEEDNYDMIVLYNGDYDHFMHKTSPEGEEAMQALKNNIKTFCEIDQKIAACWKKHNTLLAFAPDHGCHTIDGKLGSHGLDMPEDMDIIHFYKVFSAE